MRFWKKTCCAILTICLLTAGLAGCSLSGETGAEDDVLRQAAGISKDTVMMTVNGTKITAEVLCYWIQNSVNYLSQQEYDSGDVIWTDKLDGVSVPEYIKKDAAETVLLYQAVEKNALENGCTLTDEDKEELEEYRRYYIQYMGGGEESAYLEELRLQGISEETFLHFNEVGFLYEALYQKLYGEDSANQPTAEELQAYGDQYAQDMGYADAADYLEQSGYLYAKHILISTVDEEDNALPEDQKAEKKQQAEELLAQLRASEDPVALFDQLMNQYSEDPGLAQNPDGYAFTEGQMVEEFESAVKALGENEISDLVESQFGYHIILRRPNLELFRTGWGQEQFTALLENWIAEADVQYTDAFNKLDVQAFYEEMQRIYNDAYPQETEEVDTTQPVESTAPVESAVPSDAADSETTELPSAAPESEEG